MQVRRLSRPTRPVVDDLARDLAGGVVDEGHLMREESGERREERGERE
jgi:hypothetical protein